MAEVKQTWGGLLHPLAHCVEPGILRIVSWKRYFGSNGKTEALVISGLNEAGLMAIRLAP
jgi:hypothetical protein